MKRCSYIVKLVNKPVKERKEGCRTDIIKSEGSLFCKMKPFGCVIGMGKESELVDPAVFRVLVVVRIIAQLVEDRLADAVDFRNYVCRKL